MVFIFVFGLACHRYSLRRAEGKLRESSRLHKLEMKNLAEVRERKRVVVTVCVYVCMYVFVYCMYVCMCMCMYVCIIVCMYVCIIV